MTLQDLRYVVALAELRNFARAAEACHVSQPTLSTQVKKLEEELEVQLFERTNKRVMPTAMGRDLIAQARVVLEEAARLQQMAQHGHGPMAGVLRLGIIPTLGPYLLPHLIPPLRTAYPGLKLYLREEVTARLLVQIRAGELDALLLSLPIDSTELDVMALFREPFVLALPGGHPLTRKKRVRETDLQGVPMMLLEDGHCLRDQALAVCGFPPLVDSEDFRASSLETLRHMVAAGVGSTLLPLLATTSLLLTTPLLALRPFVVPVPYRTIGLVWRQRFPRQETMHTLTAFLRDHKPPGVMAIDDADCPALS